MPRNREEAIAAGIPIAETQHNMKRRKPWHDYRCKGTYLLTLVVEGRRPVLGRLVIPCANTQGVEADAQRPLSATTPTASAAGSYIDLTDLGKTIRDEEVKKISAIFKMVEIWKLCIMPDHIHMILRVTEDMPEGRHLGDVVAGFKGGC